MTLPQLTPQPRAAAPLARRIKASVHIGNVLFTRHDEWASAKPAGPAHYRLLRRGIRCGPRHAGRSGPGAPQTGSDGTCDNRGGDEMMGTLSAISGNCRVSEDFANVRNNKCQ